MREFDVETRTAHSPAAARAALLSPATWRELNAASATADAQGLTASLPLRADALPESVRRFAAGDASLGVRIEGEADAAEPLRMQITLAGAPVSVDVELDVADLPADETGPAGSVMRAHTTMASSIPLLGGVIESALEPVVREQIAKQLDKVAHLA